MASLGLLRTVWTGVAGAPYYSTMAIVADDPGNITTCRAAWLAFLGDQASNIDARLTANLDVDVPIIDSLTGALIDSETIAAGGVAMTGAGDILPSTTQALCRLRTGFVVAGRRLRGRLFLPGQTEANNTSAGLPSSGLRADVDAALAVLVGATAGDWVIYSRTHRAYASVNEATMWPEWAVLRSRRD